MEGHEHLTRPAPTEPANGFERVGPTRKREDKRFSGYEDVHWRDSELHGLDFIDVDEDEEEARAERVPTSSRKVLKATPTTSNASDSVPETLEAGKDTPSALVIEAADCYPSTMHNHKSTSLSQNTDIRYGANVDTCRICSEPAEPGRPLYHPCKCSGTIRHVHQDW